MAIFFLTQLLGFVVVREVYYLKQTVNNLICIFTENLKVVFRQLCWPLGLKWINSPTFCSVSSSFCDTGVFLVWFSNVNT